MSKVVVEGRDLYTVGRKWWSPDGIHWYPADVVPEPPSSPPAMVVTHVDYERGVVTLSGLEEGEE